MPVLEIKHLSDNVILRDVSLSVMRGKIAVLMGRNGAGKTTLLKTIMGLREIGFRKIGGTDLSGAISFMGEALQNLPPEVRAPMGIGYVPQGKRLFADMTVSENIAIGMQARKPYDKTQDEEICDFLRQLFPALEGKDKQIAGTLSGGEQQMLAIARALCVRPKLLLLDEPSDGLQPSMVQAVATCLQELKKRDMAILLVEQNADWVFDIADSVTYLKDGCTSDTLTRKSDFKKPALLNRYLGI